MPSYRSTYQNYSSDKTPSRMSPGSIVPVLVDRYSNPENAVTRDAYYAYQGFLYCDGSEYNIRDYPNLYKAVGDTYKLSGEVRNGYTRNSRLPGGSIQRTFFQNNKFFIVLSRDTSINSAIQRPAPYNSRIRFTNLGLFPTGFITLNQSYTLLFPTETVSGFNSLGYNGSITEFLYQVDISTTGVTQANYTVNFVSNGGTHPTYIISKQFDISDYPYIIGTFRVPDYRAKKLIGYGSVDGEGSPTVEDRTTAPVGATGGRWFIPRTTIDDPGVFFTIGDVKTSGYGNITTTVPAYLTGSISFTIGPLGGYRLGSPPAHTHYLLHSEVSTDVEVEASGFGVDSFAVTYRNSRGSILNFTPATADGLALEHSHGILGSRIANANLATYGNTNGIGEKDGNNYKITSSPSIPVSGSLQYVSSGNYVVVNTTNAHGFNAGAWITISGANQTQFNGSFQVLSGGLTTTSFRYTPTTAPAVQFSTGSIVLKAADGVFETVTTTESPKVWVVDNTTIIGGKPRTEIVPGTGVSFVNESLTTAGTKNIAAPAGNVTTISVSMLSPAGGGANTNTNGTNGGNASFTFTVDGTQYTITATGGRGGTSGNGGGAGGNGGTISIPAALLNDPRFTFVTNAGVAGTNGSTVTPSQTASAAGGTLSPGVANSGGGNGSSSRITQTSVDPDVTRTTSGSYTISNASNVTAVTVIMSGAGGGNGNSNANSGCQNTAAIGGMGGTGKRLTGAIKMSAFNPNFEVTIGQPGAAGFNVIDGNVNGTGSEPGQSVGGLGASQGGNGGQGAWGNGATAGAGGGSTALFMGSQPIAGAGGGGGGGGSGGGYNGGGTTDGCYAGGDAIGGTTDTFTSTTTLDFGRGGSGSSSGCTSGGGGGGGGGAGSTSQSGQGGVAGQAGVGHNGNGGGTGGSRGGSAYNPNYWDSISADNSGSAAGTAGYVTFRVTRDTSYWGSVGGGGGSGASISFTYTGTNINTSSVAVLGSAGGGASSGATGFITVNYSGQEGGGSQSIGETSPAGNYYVGNDTTGLPQGNALSSNPLFLRAEPVAFDVVNFGTGSGGGTTTGTGFNSTNVPTQVTKYIRFTGSGTRTLTFTPQNLADVRQLRFLIRVGNNSNGGSRPEEDLNLYYSLSGSTSTVFYSRIVASNVTDTGWAYYNLDLPAGNAIRSSGVTLILQQTRLSGADDNATDTQDNYGLASVTFMYDAVERQVFTPAANATIPGNAGGTGPNIGIDEVRRTISAGRSGITLTDGTFTLSSSTPISTTATVSPENDISLMTKYHRVRYLIKT